MAVEQDQQGGSSTVEELSTRLSEALTSVGLTVRRREAEIELLDKTLAQAGESTSAAARMAREKLARTREEHGEELEIVQRAHAALEQATEDCATVDQDLRGVHGELADARQKIEELTDRLREENARGEELTQSFADETNKREESEAHGKELEQTLELRDASIQELEAELAESESSLAETRGTLEKTQHDLESTQQELAETQQTLAATQDELTNKTREAEELAALMGIMPGVGDAPTEVPQDAKAEQPTADKAEEAKREDAKAEESRDAKAAESEGANAEDAQDAKAEDAKAEESQDAKAEEPEGANAEQSQDAKAEETAAEDASADAHDGEHAAAGQPGNGETTPADEGKDGRMAPPGDWGAAVDAPGANMPPPTGAPEEVPPATSAAHQSSVDEQLKAYVDDGDDGEAGGIELFQARRAIEDFQCNNPNEIKLAGALQLQAWRIGELAQLCGLDEGAVRNKLDEYVAAGLVEVKRG